MRKFFLIIMIFLLPYQYTWAMVEPYDMHDLSPIESNVQIGEIHFGHHVDCTDSTKLNTPVGNIELQNPVKQSLTHHESGKHAHCGFCHFSHGEVLSYRLPVFEAINVQFLSQYSLAYHSPTFKPLDRPNWLQST